jgi:hypothetical protein
MLECVFAHDRAASGRMSDRRDPHSPKPKRAARPQSRWSLALSFGASAAPAIVHDVLAAGGRPLDECTRSYFEPRLGADLSRVRVHDDARAAESARAVGARAYTVGEDVVLGAGAPDAATTDGRRLLAHELAHVVQAEAAPPALRRQPQTAPATASAFGDAVARRDWTTAARQLAEMTPTDRRAELTALSSEARGHLRTASLALDPTQSNAVAAEIDRIEAETAETSERDLAEAGLLALGQVLQEVVSPEAQSLRDVYNIGKLRIDAERARMIAQGLSEAEIAQRLAQMRFELAMEVRRAGSALMRQAAELIDAVRGQARPTYASLRAAGKTDAQIIASASRTNEFVNALPRNVRWTGAALWFISAGISIYVILRAPPGERAAVARREIETTLGAVIGVHAGPGTVGLFWFVD